MLARSPRKLALLSFFVFVFFVAVWHESPWATHSVYEKLPLFNGMKQQPIPNEKSRPLTPGAAIQQGSQETLNENAGPWKSDSPKGSANLDYAASRPSDLREYMKKMLNWPRPNWSGHWPPFGDYINTEYDPNRWENFPMDERPYTAGHHKLNQTIAQDPVPYKPFPDYNAKPWKAKWRGEYVACEGPRNMNLNVSTDDDVQVYKGVPEGFPEAFAGGYDVIGLDKDVCFDRYSRYGPYGFGDDEFPEEVKNWKAPATVPQWNKVRWGDLQNNCLKRNAQRFRPGARSPTLKIPSTTLPNPESASSAFATPTDTARGNMENRGTADSPKYHHRTAVLIRAWTGYQYEENDITAIRAMISELSLQSGGEYQVFLYVHVKDRNLKIFENRALYNQVLRQNVPEELRSIAILWSEAIFPSWYPAVGDWQVYWQQFMCLQYFSLTHPEFDYVWNWETDARYTGHHYHFFEKIGEFADKQPRKLLWERNKRYYMPSVHGTYEEFVEATHKEVLNASANSLIPAPVWGPRPYKKAQPAQVPLGPQPPTTFDQDKFQWGVNEPADFITLLPLWDPRNTSWSYKDKIWNYIPNVRPIFTAQDGQADWFTHPDFVDIDRRVFINTVVRFSKRMLQAMHEENLIGRSMQAEMWPSTVALQHGLKAVYAPHPIFNDRQWPAPYAEGIFDAASKTNPVTGGAVEHVQGAWTEEADSPYNHDREYNFQGWSWYYASKFPRALYRRWLNWPILYQPWGEKETVTGGKGHDGVMEENRMCMPGILLHPVKRMQRTKVQP
ncbi:hypothetical protein P280DRAFT_21741 [Massarina eburnea CBS 473.64]|uniref:DUF3405 domain-containing protein n=1 Tax=Massarina eburnea CBS 473.64 TaxID=1395130 RepID=A0A6A6SGN3_9PLEO|nr:hypothetical protein P280DRAFT_21741 [Massarina eburnea CBS 473.64]